MTKKNDFARRVRLARQRLNWTQGDRAAVSGKEIATIRRVELATIDDPIEPKLTTIRELAEALRVRLDWLVLGRGPREIEEREDSR